MLSKRNSDIDFYPIVRAYFKERGLADVQIESFNRFLDRGIQEVVDAFKEIELVENYKLVLSKVHVGRPEIDEYDGSSLPAMPSEIRLRNADYIAPIELEVKVYAGGMELKTERVRIGHLPIMVKSRGCYLYGLDERKLISKREDPRDPGGYFIINGSERVLVMRDDIAPNKVIVEQTVAENKPYSHVAQIVSARAGLRTRLYLEYYMRDGTIKASTGALRGIPVAMLLKALGLERDEDIVDAISSVDEEIRNEFLYSLDDVQRRAEEEGASGMINQEEALDYIGRRLVQAVPRADRIRYAKEYLKNNFLPHIGTSEEDFLVKAYFLAKMIEKLLKVVRGKLEPDDKDHFSNKRLRLAGTLMQEVFRDSFYQLVRRLKEKADEQLSSGVYDLDIRRIIQSQKLVTQRILRAVATGAWPGGDLGVSQNLERTNYIATLHHLRRVNSPLPAGLPLHEVRQIHGTSVGRLCPLETPEGTNVGLVRSLAIFCDVTFGTDPEPIVELVLDWGAKPARNAKPKEVGSLTPVYVNGRLVAFTDKPEDLVRFLRERRGELSTEVNFIYNKEENAVFVNADAGRMRRPLIPVSRLREAVELLPKVESGELSFTDLVKMGVVELLDADEEEYAIVAQSLDEVGEHHTHLDFAPYAMFGVAASQIPYAEHNNIPRDIIGANMVRQGLGEYLANWRLRFDSRAFLMFYPQRPIVETRGAEITGYNYRPSGQNLVVALLPMDGYNMDDALVMSRGAIDRGAARAVFFRTYESEARRHAIIEGDKFENPAMLKKVSGKKEEQYYQKLGEDGIVDPETYVEGGDVLIGKTSPPRFSPELTVGTGYPQYTFERRDTSVSMRAWERGVVSDVLLVTKTGGEKLVRVNVRETRPPELGDKFATRHGQKGVLGMIYRHEDMPFTSEGIVPDIVLDPHTIPSRMTVGQLYEIIAGKVGALEGRFVDGTPFMSEPVEDLMEALVKLGFEYSGEEVMYDGRTGRMIKAPVFIGISYYQRLKHMVRDKIHARSRGQMQLLTRQPVEGRARGGGLRLGEMEGEVLISHGAASVMKDRYVDQSDKTIVYVCKECGTIAFFNQKTNEFFCPRCQSSVEVKPLITSYASKLFIEELMSGNIDVRLSVREWT